MAQARLVQAVLGHFVERSMAPASRSSGRAGQREQPGALELEQQSRQRVGQDVVHVAGQPLPFGQRGRAQFSAAALLQLDQWPALSGPPAPCIRRPKSTMM